MKGPPAKPSPRGETLRRGIVALITGRPLTAHEISGELGLPEKEVYDHLDHIRRSLRGALVVTHPRCRGCGFAFAKRERLTRPGRCPVCRGESISPPLFEIRER